MVVRWIPIFCLQIPYIIQASLGVETNPWKLFRLMMNYQYQRGVHLLHGRNLNAAIPGFGRRASLALCSYRSVACLLGHSALR